MPQAADKREPLEPAVLERIAKLGDLPFEEFGNYKRGIISGVTAPVRELWSRRELLLLLVRRELKVRYKDSSLGFLWGLIKPLTLLLIYYVAIGKFLEADRNIPQFAIFVFTGLTIWGLYAEILTVSTASILTNAGLIKKVYLPREIFPLAAAGSALSNFFIQLALLIVATLVLGEPPRADSIMLAPAAFLVVFIYAVALGILLSALNVYLRDIQYLVEVGLLIFFWASPIVYSWELVQRSLTGPLGWLQEIYLANPITIAMIAFQRAFWSAGHELPLPANLELRLLIAGLIGLVVLWFAQRVFTRLQGNFAQEI